MMWHDDKPRLLTPREIEAQAQGMAKSMGIEF